MSKVYRVNPELTHLVSKVLKVYKAETVLKVSKDQRRFKVYKDLVDRVLLVYNDLRVYKDLLVNKVTMVLSAQLDLQVIKVHKV